MNSEELRLHTLRLAAEIAKDQPVDKVIDAARKLLEFIYKK